MEWTKTAYKLPVKPGIKAYEQVPCLVRIDGHIEILVWNCEHECWDDRDGDDYYCDPLTVDCYIPISEIVKYFPLP